MNVNPLLPLIKKCYTCNKDCMYCEEFEDMPLSGRLQLKADATKMRLCAESSNNIIKNLRASDRRSLIVLVITAIIMIVIAWKAYGNDLVKFKGYDKKFLDDKIIPALIDGSIYIDDFNNDGSIDCVDATFIMEEMMKRYEVETRVVWNIAHSIGFNHLFLQFRMNKDSKWVSMEPTTIINCRDINKLFYEVEDYWIEYNYKNNKYENINDMSCIDYWRKKCVERIKEKIK